MERHFENHTECGGSLAYNNNDKSGGDVLHNLLSSWNLRHLLDYFEAEHITMNVLKIVTKEDLPELTQNMKIGDKVMFKHHFEKWRAENNDSHTSPLCCTSSSNCSSPSSGSECELEKAKQKIKTIDILKQHKQGCLILENYKKNDKITEDQRNMLINIIVQHFETKDIKMTMEISRRIETELLKLFPTEKLQFYRTGSRGKIYIKFHNNNKRLGKTFKSEAKTNTSTSPKNQKLSKLVPERDAAVYVEILKSKIHLTAENFMSTWAACAKFRLNQIHNECKNINEALKLWPQYNEVNGFQLIDSDFHIINEQTTPQVEWKGKFAKLFEFVRSQLKRYIKDLVPPLQADGLEIDTDAYMFKILWCLHFHLYPTKKFPRTNENGEKELVRPSTKDSQESFVYIGETAQGLEEHIALLKRKGEQIPPFLMGLGEPKALHATTFYVLLDGQLMAFKSFSAAFDICFKSFHLFNIDYPGASWTFWSFIEKYLYGINRTYQQNSKVCILVDELSKM